MTAPSPILSAPLVWVELITNDLQGAAAFYAAALGWRTSQVAGGTDLVVHLDAARTAGPICGLRPRSLSDPAPPEAVAARPVVGGPADRWSVRLSPPRPPLAADPGGDQLLRPRSPGPRLARWAAQNALCFAELRTPDVEGARLWMERRLDAILEPVDPAEQPGIGTLLLQSAIDLEHPVAAIIDEPDPALAGWYPCVQVPSLEASIGQATQAGAVLVTPREVPLGCPGTAAAEVTDPGGARIVFVEHGPTHGRR